MDVEGPKNPGITADLIEGEPAEGEPAEAHIDVRPDLVIRRLAELPIILENPRLRHDAR